MPDKWEYPWFAAWDLAFHTLALEMVDPAFAKSQIDLMLSEPYLHPSGQMPAYQWNFGDVNPPGARLGDPLRLRDDDRRGRRRRRGVPPRGLQEAPLELHLVDQPQGP